MIYPYRTAPLFYSLLHKRWCRKPFFEVNKIKIRWQISSFNKYLFSSRYKHIISFCDLCDNLNFVCSWFSPRLTKQKWWTSVNINCPSTKWEKWDYSQGPKHVAFYFSSHHVSLQKHCLSATRPVCQPVTRFTCILGLI